MIKKIIGLYILFLTTNWNIYAQLFQTPIYLNENKSIEERIEDVLFRLTLEEK